MKKYLFVALALMIIAQIGVPVSMMVSRFDTLKTGTEYKFKVEPVDPYDAFRGRYVAIRVDAKSSIKEEGIQYAEITVNENGFATIEKTSKEKPQNVDYIKAKMKYSHLQLPFERYYMEEKLAPRAETVYRERARKDAYIKVKVKNGNTVIEGLYIDNIKIEDYLKENK